MAQPRSSRMQVFIYVVLVFAFSSVFYFLTLHLGSLGNGRGLYVLGLMWCPALAGMLTLRLNGRSISELGWKWQGQRFKRNGAISDSAIYDPAGNERGGYATSETGSGALISLDSANGKVFKVIANAEHMDGGTLFLFNGKHDGVVLPTHSQPTIEMVQSRKIIFKNPSDAPDVRD
jgi:hypothetical protein